MLTVNEDAVEAAIVAQQAEIKARHDLDAGQVPAWPDDWDEAGRAAYRAGMRAALLAALPHMAEWRPIATAPKDGTVILICGGTVEYDGSPFAGEMYCDGVTTVYWRNNGWCGGYGSEYNGEYWHKPTHWQPLPAPPATAIHSRGEP